MENARNYTRRLCQNGAQAKKSLGQNFLIDDGVIEEIARISGLEPDIPLVEIGPGLGVLTRVLARKTAKMWAVELDQSKLELLKKELKDLPVQIIHADALQLKLSELWGDSRGILVGNLPYYITSPLLQHFLAQENQLLRMIVMVQKEVADRLVATPGGKDYGILSIAVQLAAEVQRAFDVRSTSFWPAPKVNSTVVTLRLRPYPGFEEKKKEFFHIVKAAFSQRRKTVANSLAAGLNTGKDEILALLNQVGIDSLRRPETISILEYAALTKAWRERNTPLNK